MRRLFLLTIALSACGGPPVDRKPIAQEPIGTGAVSTPSTTSTSTSSSTASTDPPSTSTSTTSSPSAAPSPAAVPEPPDSSASSGSSGKIAELCPPKGKKPDLSRMAARNGCKDRRPPRPALLSDIRNNEQLLASTLPNTPDRELALFKIAQGYSQLECSLAAACATTARETAALPEDMTIAEARKRTEQHCATLKGEFPKSKRQCP